jgi:Family of unknown function (DUF6166)
MSKKTNVSADSEEKSKQRSARPSGCEVYHTHRGGQDFHPVLSVKRDNLGQWWIVDTAALHGDDAMAAFDGINVPHPGDEYVAIWEIFASWYAGPDYEERVNGEGATTMREVATNPFMALRVARAKLRSMRLGFRPVLGMKLPLQPLDLLPDMGEVTYRGLTDNRAAWKVWRDGEDLSCVESQALRNYSLAGFKWGKPGPGSRQLALGLLLDTLGECPGLRLLADKFAEEIVEKMQGEWTMTRNAIRDWHAGQQFPNEDSDPAPIQGDGLR